MRVLLAGATGAVGSQILERLAAEGAWVRTLSRDPARAERLRGRAQDVVVADATREADVADVARGVDVVVSALGGSVGLSWAGERRSYRSVDLIANSHLLAAAVDAGVPRFVYVGVHTAPGYAQTRYVRAHESFVGRLSAARIASTVVRPTGIFSAFAPLVPMARRGPLPVIGAGTARTNPVHPADVAEACVRYLGEGPADVSIGGPEVMTRRQIAEAVFTAIGRPPRLMRVPPWVMSAAGTLVGLVHPRLGELMDFAARVATSEGVAPPTGTRTLAAYLAELIA